MSPLAPTGSPTQSDSDPAQSRPFDFAKPSPKELKGERRNPKTFLSTETILSNKITKNRMVLIIQRQSQKTIKTATWRQMPFSRGAFVYDANVLSLSPFCERVVTVPPLRSLTPRILFFLGDGHAALSLSEVQFCDEMGSHTKLASCCLLST